MENTQPSSIRVKWQLCIVEIDIQIYRRSSRSNNSFPSIQDSLIILSSFECLIRFTTK